MIELRFQCPPSVNELYGINRYGKRYKKKAHADYLNYVQSILIKDKILPLEGEVKFEVVWYRKILRGDTDNILKTLCDALQVRVYRVKRKVVKTGTYGLFHNDSQIADLHILRKHDKENPRIEIRCEPIL